MRRRSELRSIALVIIAALALGSCATLKNKEYRYLLIGPSGFREAGDRVPSAYSIDPTAYGALLELPGLRYIGEQVRFRGELRFVGDGLGASADEGRVVGAATRANADAMILGDDWRRDPLAEKIRVRLVIGRMPESGSEMLISQEARSRLECKLGDAVALICLGSDGLIREKSFTLCGAYDADAGSADGLVSIEAARELLGMDGLITNFSLSYIDGGAVERALAASYPELEAYAP